MSVAVVDDPADLDPAAVVGAALADPRVLCSDELLDDIVALEGLKAWADARQQRMLAQLATTPVPPAVTLSRSEWKPSSGSAKK